MRAFAIANLEREPDAAFFERVRRLAEAKVDWILLRDKGLDDAMRLRNAERCRRLIAAPSRLLIHGRGDLAAAVGADGVHLAAAGLPAEAVAAVAPGTVMGRSCHSVADCAAAAREGLAYALLGPVFPTRSKPGEARIGRSELARAATLEIDIYALGGISLATFGELKGIQLAGVAAVTLFMADEPLEEIVEAVRRS
jgi:thiamine-phosphate pyrophosphorylase